MTTLPITHMTLYKHGVGFFERRAKMDGEEVKVSFRVEDMNDVLKSLTAIDWGGGQVLGIDYATPQSREERLAGCSIRLGDNRSLRDLLAGLRGRRVRLLLDQDEAAIGTLLGLDEVPERQPLGTSLVSLMLDGTAQVQTYNLARVLGVEILDEQGASDLRFFLETALAQEQFRQVTVRLTPGEHDLSVSYIAPAPTWRVSYRLVLEPQAQNGKRALLLGWGIFDNKLEEDLKGISLALIAGMPISFVYDLYTPFTPERPVVEEEARVAAAPVEFQQAVPTLGAAMEPPMAAPKMAMRAMAMAAVPAPSPINAQALADAAPVQAKGQAMGELFQYLISTPVTAGRGQSAMVPIVSMNLDYHKDLLYNGRKLPAHPVATVRLKNESGLTLERGPVTVLEKGEYVGEAILPFTVTEAEFAIPYAVELGVQVREESGASSEIHALQIKRINLHVEEWDIRWREYRFNNRTSQAIKVLVEHPRNSYYELFDTPEPRERTDEHLRFEVEVPARGEVKLRVNERRLITRVEELRRQSYDGLRRYLRQGLINRQVHDRVNALLKLWEKIGDDERALAQSDKERDKIYKAQEQIRGNLGALGQSGKEGAMRARYVEQLEATEEQLKQLAAREASLRTEIEKLKQEAEKIVEGLGGE